MTEANHAIQVHYGTLALQFGIGNVPNLSLRFYRYLVHTDNGQQLRLSDAEAMLLVHVMALRRLSNLPMATSLRKREDYLGKLRKMGLIFTSRIYCSRDEMIAYYGRDNLPDLPCMKAQQLSRSRLGTAIARRTTWPGNLRPIPGDKIGAGWC